MANMDTITIKINNWDQNQIPGLGNDGESFPQLTALSGAFIYQFLPMPKERAPLEFITVDCAKKNYIEAVGTMASWNSCWEAGHFRNEVCGKNLPKDLKHLQNIEDRNVYVLPRLRNQKYGVFFMLHHLLPEAILKKFSLPIIKNCNWPFTTNFDHLSLPSNYDEKLSQAFAYYIWPFMNSRSGISSFTKDDPIKFLAHNLDYWLGPAFLLAENRLQQNNFAAFENDNQRKDYKKILSSNLPDEIVVNRPRKGGPIWWGAEDALEATRELIELADKQANLRSIIDAVQSDRIQDDFSNKWSYEKEDFERALYSKRTKVKVSFVELDETIPVISNESEVDNKLMWEDFITLLNPKEKSIIVCLRNGETKLGDIAKELGYANHSPVSKALKKVQKKAKYFFENS